MLNEEAFTLFYCKKSKKNPSEFLKRLYESEITHIPQTPTQQNPSSFENQQSWAPNSHPPIVAETTLKPPTNFQTKPLEAQSYPENPLPQHYHLKNKPHPQFFKNANSKCERADHETMEKVSFCLRFQDQN